jgi:NAD(P)-dependent dehydrogenase (short-subunit alcohol dehydrogenase family)
MADKQRLKGKIALITGASRGIGAAVAHRYAREGADLILVARDVVKLEAIDDSIRPYKVNVTLVPLDLSKHYLIDEMASSIYKRFKKIDILLGNAGILGTLGPVAHTSSIDWGQVIDVNLTANWRLIRAFDPLLKKSDAGRAIFVTSGIASSVLPYWGAYATSKAALNMLVKIYASEVEKTSVKANIIDPGIVRTNMFAQAMPGKDPMSVTHPRDITDAFVDLADATCLQNGKIVKAQMS